MNLDSPPDGHYHLHVVATIRADLRRKSQTKAKFQKDLGELSSWQVVGVSSIAPVICVAFYVNDWTAMERNLAMRTCCLMLNFRTPYLGYDKVEGGRVGMILDMI